MRRAILTVALVLVLGLVDVASAGLVVHYEFEGNANDSASSNHGMLFGNPTYETGVYGQAIDVDGAGDYVETGKTASGLGIGGNLPRTVSAWVYTHSFNNGGIFEVGGGTLGGDFSLTTTPRDDWWRMQIWGGSGYDFDFSYNSKNKWVHFAQVRIIE